MACHLRLGVHFQRESDTRGGRAQTSVRAPGHTDFTSLSHNHTRKESHAILLSHTPKEERRTKRALLEDGPAVCLKGGWGFQGTAGGRMAAA